MRGITPLASLPGRVIMVIKKCTEAEIEAVGTFYDRNVENMDKCGTNYPKWQYRVYPTEASVREKTGAGAQYLCMSGGKICGAFVFNEDPEGAYEKAKWENILCYIPFALIMPEKMVTRQSELMWFRPMFPQ